MNVDKHVLTADVRTKVGLAKAATLWYRAQQVSMVGRVRTVDEPNELIEASWQARLEGRHDEAESGLLKAIAASRAEGTRTELIRGLKALAHVLRDVGRGESALPLYIEAVALSRDEGNALLLAHTVRHLGDLHREDGRLAEADECYAEALALYRAESQPPPLDMANALRPAALVREANGDVVAARSLWFEARRCYEAAGIAVAVQECERHLSKLP